jgi:hypothetical protein
MKTLKLIFIIASTLLFCVDSIFAQSDQISTEKYNSDEYTVKHNKYLYEITNKKYAFKGVTVDIEFEGERLEDLEKRREGFMESIYKVANGVFDFSNIPVFRKSLFHLTMVCYFDSSTKDYVGVQFVFNIEVKSYITLQKLNLLESKLQQAKLNAGRTNLMEPNKKYFAIEIRIPMGK